MFVKTVRCRVMEPVPVRTTDAATRDTLLTPPTDAEVLSYLRALPRMDLGEVWDGNARFREAKAALDRLSVAQLRDALAGLAKYSAERPDAVGSGEGLESSEANNGPAGSLTFGGTKDNGANAMRAWRNQDFQRIEETQAVLNKFYGTRKPSA